jgi:hypothetical protein
MQRREWPIALSLEKKIHLWPAAPHFENKGRHFALVMTKIGDMIITRAVLCSSYNDMTSIKPGIDSKFRISEQIGHGSEANRPALPRGKDKDLICTGQRARTKDATWASERRGLRYEL